MCVCVCVCVCVRVCLCVFVLVFVGGRWPEVVWQLFFSQYFCGPGNGWISQEAVKNAPGPSRALGGSTGEHRCLYLYLQLPRPSLLQVAYIMSIYRAF